MTWGTYIYHQRCSAAGFNGSYFSVVPHEVLSHLYFKRWSCDTSYGSIAYPKHRREERQHLNHLPFTIYQNNLSGWWFLCYWLLVVFYQWSSSIKGCLPSKVVFHQRSSSIKGRIPSKAVCHQRSSSIKGRLTCPLIVSDMLSQPPLKLTVTGGQAATALPKK